MFRVLLACLFVMIIEAPFLYVLYLIYDWRASLIARVIIIMITVSIVRVFYSRGFVEIRLS